MARGAAGRLYGMTVPGDPTPPSAPDRATLDRIFGDVLPETTRDDRDDEPPGRELSWYEQNRPPHHGD